MSTMEYSETDRDQKELELYNKRELIRETRDSLVIILWWLRQTNELSLELIDERANETQEAVVPNHLGMDAVAHPYYYLANQTPVIKIKDYDGFWTGQPWEKHDK